MTNRPEIYPVILNIGLEGVAPVGRRSRSLVVLHALRAAGFTLEGWNLGTSDTEETLIAEGFGISDKAIHRLSVDLNQDCIAVYDRYHREGRLVGPEKEKWGEFDPAFFFLLNGSRMSEARSTAG